MCPVGDRSGGDLPKRCPDKLYTPKRVDMDDEATNKALWEETLRRIRPPPSERSRFAAPRDARLTVVMVEFREHAWLRPVLLNAAHVYGGRKDVALTVVCGLRNREFVESVATAGLVGVTVEVVPLDNADIPTYNRLLTSVEFYARFAPCKTILLIQTDTLTRRAVPDRYIDAYAYIGAPWAGPQNCGPTFSVVGNGGYSLRRVSAMIDACAQRYDPVRDMAEDLFFSKHCTTGVAPADVAREFSVEHMPHDDPCGMHQAWRFHPRVTLLRWLDGLPGTLEDTVPAARMPPPQSRIL
jgi:hypothetical protein